MWLALSHFVVAAEFLSNSLDLLVVLNLNILHQLSVDLNKTLADVILHLELNVIDTLFMLELYDLLQVLYLSLEVSAALLAIILPHS